MPASERASVPRRPQSPSMRDLLASCAAAAAVSTPPDRRDGAAAPASAPDPAAARDTGPAPDAGPGSGCRVHPQDRPVRRTAA